MKITISSKVSKYYTIFKEGTAEDVVNLIRTHEGIISDKKLKQNNDRSYQCQEETFYGINQHVLLYK